MDWVYHRFSKLSNLTVAAAVDDNDDANNDDKNNIDYIKMLIYRNLTSWKMSV